MIVALDLVLLDLDIAKLLLRRLVFNRHIEVSQIDDEDLGFVPERDEVSIDVEPFKVFVRDSCDLEAISLSFTLELDESATSGQEVYLVACNDLIDLSRHIDLLVVEGDVLLLVFEASLVIELTHRNRAFFDSFGDDTIKCDLDSLDRWKLRLFLERFGVDRSLIFWFFLILILHVFPTFFALHFGWILSRLKISLKHVTGV